MPDDKQCILIEQLIDKQNDLYVGREREKVTLQVLYGIVIIVGTLANLFIIFTIASHRSLHNLRTGYIAHLACSDLVVCLVTAPITLWRASNVFWDFGDFSCKMVGTVQAVNTFLSTLTLAAIALDRYLLVAFPISWRRPNKALCCILGVVWLLSFVIAAPYFKALGTVELRLGIWNTSKMIDTIGECGLNRPQICGEFFWGNGLLSGRTYTLTVLLCQYLLPLFGFLFVYVSIARQRLCGRNRVRRFRRTEKKKLCLVTALVLVFGVCWLPGNLHYGLDALGIIEFDHFVHIYFHLVGMMTACINPVLYGLFNTNIQRSISATRQSSNANRPLQATLEVRLDPHRQRSHTVSGPVRTLPIPTRNAMARSNPDVKTELEMLPLDRSCVI